eukprot:c17906_g1_i1.p1 GENE.c17906_g1_i1~~c17906_g1_i1.p1  ORF type:complete len:503 (-),score=237.15 c17906_g1_i1:59-1567(-)
MIKVIFSLFLVFVVTTCFVLQPEVDTLKSKSRDNWPLPQYFVQKQDHFDGTNQNTWNQAYYVNDTFWVPGSKAPVFICVGGEGPPLDGSVVVSSVHCNIAVEWLQDQQALMFAVEHRYYGCHNMSACPVDNFDSVSSYKYLSSSQALSDLAQFYLFATEKYNLTKDNKWVSWGGSYPGMLAGWFRLKFPHLVYASVASSAPTTAQLDMVGYNDVVGEAFNSTSAGGSPECYKLIKTGHDSIGQMMNGSDSDRQVLATTFGVSDPNLFNNVTFQRFFSGYGVAIFDAQSNDPACEEDYCNIEKICAFMTNTSVMTPIQRLAVLHANSQEKLKLSKSELLAAGVNPRSPWIRAQRQSQFHFGDWDGDACWNWQTCTEFGFYATCEIGSKCMFTQGLVSVETESQFCSTQFGISLDAVQNNIDFTNAYYGAGNPEGSRVLWPNGEIDPWHSLAILTPPNPQQSTLWVVGASHHFWTHPSLPTDKPEIIEARQKIRQTVQNWLMQA